MRHAKSDWGQPGLDDFDRPLNQRGREAADLIGLELANRDCAFDVTVSSPAARTRETVERVGLADRARWEEEIYLASTDTLLGVVRSLPAAAQSAMIVGHNPGLQDLLLCLARPDSGTARKRVLEKFPTAALAFVDLEIESWEDVGPCCGTIGELILPRELD